MECVATARDDLTVPMRAVSATCSASSHVHKINSKDDLSAGFSQTFENMAYRDEMSHSLVNSGDQGFNKAGDQYLLRSCSAVSASSDFAKSYRRSNHAADGVSAGGLSLFAKAAEHSPDLSVQNLNNVHEFEVLPSSGGTAQRRASTGHDGYHTRSCYSDQLVEPADRFLVNVRAVSPASDYENCEQVCNNSNTDESFDLGARLSGCDTAEYAEAEDDGEDSSYEDWFAVADDEDDEEIRTMASTDLRAFCGDACSGADRLTTAHHQHLQFELTSQPDVVDGFSCLETIVEENSDDMRSEVDSLRSGPVSWSWSVDSEDASAAAPAAVQPGPPGWTWCLEPTPDSVPAAVELEPGGVWNCADDGEMVLYQRPPSPEAETSPNHASFITRSPEADAPAVWCQQLELEMRKAALRSDGVSDDRYWRVTSAVNCDTADNATSDPDDRRRHASDLCRDAAVTVTAAAGSSANRCGSGPPVIRGQGSASSPTLSGGLPGYGNPDVDMNDAYPDSQGGFSATEVLRMQQRNAPAPPSHAEMSSAVPWCDAGRHDGRDAPAAVAERDPSVRAAPAEAAACLQPPRWDLGSCEDFGNLDRRIESLTFDFEEEERRTLATIAEVERLRLYDRYRRFLAEQNKLAEEPTEAEQVRRCRSWCDLRMAGDAPAAARRERSGLKKWAASAAERRPTSRVTQLRHSSENLSEDSGFGEQAPVSLSDASSPPPSVSPPVGSELPPLSRLMPHRRSRSTPDLSPSAQRRRRLRELIGRDEQRRASVLSTVGDNGEQVCEKVKEAQEISEQVQNNSAELANNLSEADSVYVNGSFLGRRNRATLSTSTDAPSCASPCQPRPRSCEVIARSRPPASPQKQRRLQKPPMPTPRTVFTRSAGVYQNIPSNAWISAPSSSQVTAARDQLAPGETDLDSGMCGVLSSGVANALCADASVAVISDVDTVTGQQQQTIQTTDVDSARALTSRQTLLCPPDAGFYNEHDSAKPSRPTPAQPAQNNTVCVVCCDSNACVHVDKDNGKYDRMACGGVFVSDLDAVLRGRDIWRADAATAHYRERRTAAGRPKPLDLAAAEEFVQQESGWWAATAAATGGHSGAQRPPEPDVTPPAPAAGGVDSDDDGVQRAAADSRHGRADPPPISAPELAPAPPPEHGGTPGNRRRWRSAPPEGGGAPAGAVGGAGCPAGVQPWWRRRRRTASAADLRQLPSMNAAGRVDFRRGDYTAATAAYPGWLDESMESDVGETRPVIGGLLWDRLGAPVTSAGSAGVSGACSRPAAAAAAGRRPGDSCIHSAAAPPATERRCGVQQHVSAERVVTPTTAHRAAMGRTKGVQFSPVVSEVRWRETYMDDDDEPDPPLISTAVMVARVDRGRPPPPPPPARTKSLTPPRPAAGAASAPLSRTQATAGAGAATQKLRVSFPVVDDSGECVRRQVLTCERADVSSGGGADSPDSGGGSGSPAPAPRAHPPPAADMEHVVGIMRGKKSGVPPVAPAPREAVPAPPPRPEKPPRPSVLQRLSFGRLSTGMTAKQRERGGVRHASRSSRSPSPVSVVVKSRDVPSPLRSAGVAKAPSFGPGMVTSTPLTEVRRIPGGDSWTETSSADTSTEASLPNQTASLPPMRRVFEPVEAENPFRDEFQSKSGPVPIEASAPAYNLGKDNSLEQSNQQQYRGNSLSSVPNYINSQQTPPSVRTATVSSATKPPLPPRMLCSQAVRTRMNSAKQQFLSQSGRGAVAAPQLRPVVAPDARPADASDEVRAAFERFCRQTEVEREKLALSTPDLSLIETTTRGLVQSPSPPPPPPPLQLPSRQLSSSCGPAADRWQLCAERRARLERESAALRVTTPPPPCQETDLDAIVRGLQQFIDEVTPRRAAHRARSLLHLQPAAADDQLPSEAADARARSMEFLLDDENKASAAAPENSLMQRSAAAAAAHQLSQHQLRFQRSLRNLNTPDWYRNSARPSPPLRQHASGSAPPAGGWSGLHSKTTSRESLPCSAGAGGAAATPVPFPRRLWHTSSTSSRAESLSDATERRTRRDSDASAASGASALSALRRPYLGWRSQEKLNGGYQTAAERLASSFGAGAGSRRQLSARNRAPAASSDGAAGIGRARAPPEVAAGGPSAADRAQDVQRDIRDVTDAIVQYFDGAAEPNGDVCSVEDSPPPPRPPLPRAAPPPLTPPNCQQLQRPPWRETAFVPVGPLAGDDGIGGAAVHRASNSPPAQSHFELGEYLAV